MPDPFELWEKGCSFASKPQIILSLKRLREDYEATEGDESMQKVIDWLINCTPEYKGEQE